MREEDSMIYPLKSVQIVDDGQFGSDPTVYAQYGLRGHHGVDLVADIGTPVYASENATVMVSSKGAYDQYTNAYIAGEVIVLQGSYEHWFLHLSRRNVVNGQRIVQGQLIGYTGNTGAVFPQPTEQNPNAGAHLHWGVRPLTPDISNGYRGFIDPMKLMKEESETVKITHDIAENITLLATGWDRPDRDGGSFVASLEGQEVDADGLKKMLDNMLASPQRRDLINKLNDSVRIAQQLQEKLKGSKDAQIADLLKSLLTLVGKE